MRTEAQIHFPFSSRLKVRNSYKIIAALILLGLGITVAGAWHYLSSPPTVTNAPRPPGDKSQIEASRIFCQSIFRTRK